MSGVALRLVGDVSIPDPQTPVERAFHPPATPVADDIPPAWETATTAARDRAAARLAAVERAERLVGAGASRADADAEVAAEAGVSVASLGRWRARVRGRPRGARLAALLDAPRRGRPRFDWDDTEGAEVLWRHWVSDWCREERPDAAAVYRRLKRIAAAHGWWLPPLRAFRGRTRRELGAAARVRAREGRLAAMDLVPYQERTVAGLGPLAIVNGDGRRHDVWVVLPSGRVGRPVVWMWQDVWSRRILAWRAGETETADLVRVSLHELVVHHGVPTRVVVDQTRAASALWLTGGQPHRKRWRSDGEELPGVLARLDIEYRPTAVDRDAAGRGKGRGRSKPIERAFGDLARQIDTHPSLAGAATGRSTTDRPETHRTRAVPWETFLAVVDAAVREHNARPGRRTEAAAGESFDAAWARGVAETVVRRITAAQAAVLLLAGELSTVQRDGTVRLKTGHGPYGRNRYCAPVLVEHAGRKVEVRFDPDRLHDPVQVWDTDGRWLAEAACIQPVGFRSSTTARAHERARRKVVRAGERELAAQRDLGRLRADLDAAPAPDAPPEPEPAATRLVPGAPRPGPAPARTGGRGRMAAALAAVYPKDEAS